jgi:KaiC/GvpD/RAD55 family RecA-like ATPase
VSEQLSDRLAHELVERRLGLYALASLPRRRRREVGNRAKRSEIMAEIRRTEHLLELHKAYLADPQLEAQLAALEAYAATESKDERRRRIRAAAEAVYA